MAELTKNSIDDDVLCLLSQQKLFKVAGLGGSWENSRACEYDSFMKFSLSIGLKVGRLTF